MVTLLVSLGADHTNTNANLAKSIVEYAQDEAVKKVKIYIKKIYIKFILLSLIFYYRQLKKVLSSGKLRFHPYKVSF